MSNFELEDIGDPFSTKPLTLLCSFTKIYANGLSEGSTPHLFVFCPCVPPSDQVGTSVTSLI